MIKKTFDHIDFNGTKRVAELYFNLSPLELTQLQLESEHGIQKVLEDAIADNDLRKVFDFLDNLIKKSYGIKSDDGRYFRKTPEIIEDLVSSPFYSDFVLGLLENDAREGAEFIKGLVPASLIEAANKLVTSQTPTPAAEPEVENVFKPNAREQFAQAQAAKLEGQTDVGTAPYIPNTEAPQSLRVAPTRDELLNMTPEEFQAYGKSVHQQTPPSGNISAPQHEIGPGFQLGDN